MTNIERLSQGGNNQRLFASTVIVLKESQGFYCRMFIAVNAMDEEDYTQLCTQLDAQNFKGHDRCNPLGGGRMRYGYKVCYRERGSATYIRHFITHTYTQAVECKHSYARYPPTARDDNHILNKPTWKVLPITLTEVRAGIWQEAPF